MTIERTTRMTQYMLGVDLGTTSTKAVLFTCSGKLIKQATVEYPLHTPVSGAAEQDPDGILAAVKIAVKTTMEESGIEKKALQLTSFSAAMHSLIAVDNQGSPLTAAITWADQRSEPYAKKLKETNGHAIYLKTGTPIHPMSPLVKLIWLREEQPELFDKAAKFIGIKEYIFYHLFGEYAVDYSIASATGLMSMESLNWDSEALETAQVTPEKLSRIVPTTEQFSGLSAEQANELGVRQDVPFIVGANDGCLANLGVNAIQPGVVAVTIGTSGAIRTVTDKPVSDPKGRIFCYALTEKHWVIGGPINNGGMILRWLRDELCSEEIEKAKAQNRDPYDIMMEIIDQVEPGAEGLLFHPYLTGERAPSWNANARGSFFGLGMHHKKKHMMRAVLEGINMNLYSVLLALEELIGIPEKVHATGGFAKSAIWRQMLADIMNQEVHIPATVESACLGAAVLGLYALDEINDLSEIENMVKTNQINTPKSKNVEIYKELMPLYIRLSRLFEKEYDAVVEFQNKKW